MNELIQNIKQKISEKKFKSQLKNFLISYSQVLNNIGNVTPGL